jgi:hypothetical protein
MNYVELKREHERRIWIKPIDISKSISTEWFQYILDNPEKPWNYFILSRNENITLNIILQNSNISWHNWKTRQLIYNDDYVANHGDLIWKYYCLSHNTNTTWECVELEKDKPWDYNALSHNSQYWMRVKRRKKLVHIRMLSEVYNIVRK